MCLASTDPGGPRRCSGDTRAGYQKSSAAAAALDAQRQRLLSQLITDPAEHRPSARHDELLARLAPAEVDTLIQARRDHLRPAVDAAFAALPAHLTDTARDTTIAEHGEITIHRHSGTDTTPATLLDAHTAVYRTRRGDYAIAYEDGQAYRTIATASKYKTALAMANRIPTLNPLDQPPGGIDDLQQQAYRAHADTALQLATQAAYGRLTTPEEQSAFLAERLTHARDEIVDAAAATPLHNAVLDATLRHRHRQRLDAAQAAGDAAARAAAASGDDPEQAYTTAYRHCLGTPTLGGAHIPHFAHHTLPAASLGDTTHNLLQRNGIRCYGAETAHDYTVTTRRGGDLKAWGLHDVYGTLRTSQISELTTTHARFVNTVLTADEREALRTYTSGRHIGSGAYIQINDVFTGRTTTPAPAVANTCAHLRSAFDKHARHNRTHEPVTVVRGTRLPTEWASTTADYLTTAFPVGAKVELGQVTSATTRTATAIRFSDREPGAYVMAIRTRDGLPVKAISANAGEDEVILPPGTALRCVRVDATAGVEHRPTVYLVAEDLVAEAESALGERVLRTG